jgi:glycosyltransferase involved in cell wall biosynthesis
MRVAFTLIGGAGWTGGVNYLENLLSAISAQPSCNIQPVLFVGTDADPKVLERLAPYLAQPPILSKVWNNDKLVCIVRLFFGFCLQRDFFAEHEFRRANVDVVFQHAAWYGCLFGIPTLAWIADFQHRRLPMMFSRTNYYWRDVGYWALSRCATRLMVSSQDAKNDCETFYPKSIGRVDSIPFAVRMSQAVSVVELQEICSFYNLPEKFYFLPNQFWKHKNHLNVIEALNLINKAGSDVVIVASGNPKDGRNPEHPQRILDAVKSYGLEDKFIFLGLIPFQHILPLMRLSAGVLNPSFFEGWSTTVEEAKAVGAPMLLSDLPIHREQADGKTPFFDPNNPEKIAAVIGREWQALSPGPRLDAEQAAVIVNQQHRKQFALAFAALVNKTYEQR